MQAVKKKEEEVAFKKMEPFKPDASINLALIAPSLQSPATRVRLGPSAAEKVAEGFKEIVLLAKTDVQQAREPTSVSKEQFKEVQQALDKYLQEQGKTWQELSPQAKLKAIYELMRSSELLGIQVKLAKGMPKTPDEVLKTKNGDCDELARTYVAIAEKLGIKLEEFKMLEIAWKVKYKGEEETKISLHACIVKVGKERFLIDPGLGIPPKPLKLEGPLKDNPQLVKALNDEYQKDEQGNPRYTIDRAEIVGVDEQQKYRLLETRQQFASLYYYQLGGIFRNENRFEEAVKACETAYKLDETNWRAKDDLIAVTYDLGIKKRSEGKLEEAEKLFERTVQLKPDHVRAHHELGVAYNRQGKIDKARKEIEYVLKVEPSNIAYYNAGIIFGNAGDLQTAISMFRKAIELNEKDLGAYYELARRLIQTSRYDEAISVYKKMLEIDQTYARAYLIGEDAYHHLALSNLANNNFEKAEENAREALGIITSAINSRYATEGSEERRILKRDAKEIKKTLKAIQDGKNQ